MDNNLYKKIMDGVIKDYTFLKNTNNLDNLPLFNFIFKKILENIKYLYKSNFASISSVLSHDFSITPYSNEKVESISLDFYNTLDKRFYKKALDFITNQNNLILENSDLLPFSGINLQPHHIYHNEYKEEMISRKKPNIIIKPTHTIKDTYSYVHEIAHSFSYSLNNGVDNNFFLHEIIPFFSEALLDDYLLKKQLVSKQFVYRRNVERFNFCIINKLFTTVRFILIAAYPNNLTENFINNILKKYKITPIDLFDNYEFSLTNDIPYTFAYLFSTPFFKDLLHNDKSRAYQIYLQLCIDLKENIDSKKILSHLGFENNSDIESLIKNSIIYSNELLEQYKSFMPQFVDSDLLR